MNGSFEKQLLKNHYELVIGIDEAGRGPLAGPVVSAAVSLVKPLPSGLLIDDSKKLTADQRENAYHSILKCGHVGVGIIDEKIIDEINILQATFRAMNQAVENLMTKIPCDLSPNKVCLLIDGDQFKTKLPYDFQTIVKGDSSVLSIACASIVAKVTRDKMMTDYHKIYPQYGFGAHKGYATKAHKDAIKQFGFCPLHRRTFNV